MRKLLLPAVLLAFGSPAVLDAQTLLSYWNFNNDSSVFGTPANTYGQFSTTDGGSGEVYTGGTTRQLSSNTAVGAAFSGSGTYLAFNGLIAGVSPNVINGIDSVTGTRATTSTGSSGYAVFSDTTLNRVAGDASTGGSLQFVNSANRLAGKNVTLSLSSTGYEDLQLSYATRWSNNTSGTQTWTYSLDGTNFFSITGGALSMASSASSTNFTTFSLNLASLAAIENVSNFYLRMTFTAGGTPPGSFSFDNLQVTGIAAVPEPGSWSLLLLGAGGLALLRLRPGSRQRR
jgi:hypothetical protein